MRYPSLLQDILKKLPTVEATANLHEDLTFQSRAINLAIINLHLGDLMIEVSKL